MAVQKGISAEKLLQNFPQWWAWARNLDEQAAEDVAWEGYNAELQAVFRKVGLPGDPTAKRAMKLLEINELQRIIKLTGEFVRGLTREVEQRTVIGMWRMGNVGVDWAARSAGLTIAELETTWSDLVRRLEAILVDKGITLLGLRESKLGLPLLLDRRKHDSPGREGADVSSER
ncbi:MAG: hypothetical protein AB1374_04875 [Bacillota bacterium]